MIGGMPLKKTNEMPKNQTGNHATVPKLMGKGPKYPFAFYVALVLSMTVGAVPVLAAGDPLAVINNLSTFIFSLIRAIGLILTITFLPLCPMIWNCREKRPKKCWMT